MKISLTCNQDDEPKLEVLRENDALQMMDLMAMAFTAGKKVVLYQIDNSGVTVDREYPTKPEPPAPSVPRRAARTPDPEDPEV